MFAVPGWSLSSGPKRESVVAKPSNDSKPKETSTPNDKNNKRKRGNDNVTRGNVDEMYRKHIEGYTPKPVKRKDKKPKKEKKEADEQVDEQAEPAVTNNTEEKAPASEAQKNESTPQKKQKKNKKNKDQKEGSAAAAPAPETSALAAPPTTTATLTPLQQAMRQKLISSRFRHLNETLYTTDSSKAVELFNANPELFSEYHAGFSRQVKESWPSNPVDGYIQFVRRRGAVQPPRRGNKLDPNKPQPLPRRPNGSCTIADLGCGDAGLARALTPSSKKLNIKVKSYDLQAPDPLITKADISNLPLEDGSVDVTVFCLSLMGTNWVSFVEEAWRVLRADGKGECWVSEVKSRFGKVTRKKAQIGAQKPLSKTQQKKLPKKKGDDEDEDDADIFAEDARPKDNNDDTDISAFVEVFRTRGFILKQETVDKSNKMFVKMEFIKTAGATPSKGKHASSSAPAPVAGKKRFVDRKPDAGNGMTPEQEAQVLKPCVYKIR
ncbi:hypothetical protein N7490_002447 [Penicillium lividum]|nr:hypothetical protein N7490_002447 [Penicillium lividum]